MSIQASELKKFGAANRPINDVSTSGGAIDATDRPVFTQLASSKTIRVRSDGADVRNVTLVGRDAAGAIVQEVLVLNGVTAVNGAQSFERLHSITLSATDAARTVTIETNEGAPAAIATIGPNEASRTMLFRRAASEASPVARYEKEFWKNDNGGGFALLNANVTLTADPSTKHKIGLEASVNGSGSVANRKSAPAGVTFVDDGVSQNVPGTNLAAGAAIGVWIEQALLASDAPVRTTYTTRLAGETT